MFPEAFIQRLQKDLGATRTASLLKALQGEAVVSVRNNPAKAVAPVQGSAVAWNPDGVILPERPAFIEDPLWHAGAYYVQEASSMFLQYVTQQLQLPGKVLALDACAAPGGKSTLLLSALPDGSILIANEVIASRNAILRENIIRWGNPNCIVTQADPAAFATTESFFDLVLVDAPCSGEGLFRKDKASIGEWSTANTELCALRQNRILDELAASVKSGGYLIYSTCTYNPAENFAAPSLLLQQGFESLQIPVPADWNIEEKQQNGVTGYAFYPDKVQGEGFFISIFRKRTEEDATFGNPKNIRGLKTAGSNEWSAFLAEPQHFELRAIGGRQYIVPQALQRILASLHSIKVTYAGIDAGEKKGSDHIPSHAMALSTALSPEVRRLELDRQQALVFLRKESLQPRPELEKGLYLVTYKGLGLGWAKNIGNRFNNLLPAEYRIRKQLG
ncbi:MAG: RNA methyltransferase [Bacteroidia bacterium]|nr:RNA methyltransferase [Bacteroidia bacterium]